MKLIQIAIFAAVIGTGIYLEWSDDVMFVLPPVALGLVLAPTVLPVYVIDRYRDWRAGRPYIPSGERFRQRRPTDLAGAWGVGSPPGEAIAAPPSETDVSRRPGD